MCKELKANISKVSIILMSDDNWNHHGKIETYKNMQVENFQLTQVKN